MLNSAQTMLGYKQKHTNRRPALANFFKQARSRLAPTPVFLPNSSIYFSSFQAGFAVIKLIILIGITLASATVTVFGLGMWQDSLAKKESPKRSS